MAMNIPVGRLVEGPVSLNGEEAEGFAGEIRLAGLPMFSGRVKVFPNPDDFDRAPPFLVHREGRGGEWETIGSVFNNRSDKGVRSLSFSLLGSNPHTGRPLTARLVAFIDPKASAADQKVWSVKLYADEEAA